MCEINFNPDDYKKLFKIGQGSFASVIKVINKNTDKEYALKKIKADISQLKQKELDDILTEVNIMSKLNHPSIIKYFGFSSQNFKKKNKPMILLEYAANGTLGNITYLANNSRAPDDWDETQKLIVIFGIASGMLYLHSQGIVHLDLKPDNILMDEKLFPKISDFGLSKFSEESHTSITTKGTPLYMAPEIWVSKLYGKEADVYAFSLIMYEILTSEVPFSDHKDITKLFGTYFHEVVEGGLRPELDCSIPASFRELIQQCWAADPSQRPTFAQIVESLKTDEGFRENVVEDDFEQYIEYIEKDCNITFKNVHVPQKIVENDFDANLADISEEGLEKLFQLGKNCFEGINGVKQDVNLGIKYLKKASKCKCIEATIYLCRELISGKRVKKNIKQAKKYIDRIIDPKYLPIIYSLYAEIGKEEGNVTAERKYFQMGLLFESPKAQFEYGKMLLKDSINYLIMAKNNGNDESDKFLSENLPKYEEIFSLLENKIECDIPVVSDWSKEIEIIDYVKTLNDMLEAHPKVEGRKRAVLICTGSFCPVHKGFLKLLDTAKAFLSEEHGIDSILGILSPSSDIWVSYKFKNDAISFKHRYKMLQLACDEHNKDLKNDNLMIIPNEWEGTQKAFIDYPYVYDYFVKDINKKFPDEDLMVLYVCGGEFFMAQKCFKEKGFVGISRPGFTIDPPPDQIAENVFYCNDKKYTGFYNDASRAIKLARENGESLYGLTYDAVAKYLHDVVHYA